MTLVHSGLLYPSERDPSAFFDALSELRRAGRLSATGLRVILRASGNEASYRSALRDRGIQDLVDLAPPVPYAEALVELLRADGLLLFQASNCNHQIPAKLYEYFRARRPIFAMTDPVGDTATALRSAGIDTVVALDSKEAIGRGLLAFLDAVRANRAPLASATEIERHSRRARTRELASLLETACATT